MARARNIKPGFFTNELLGTFDPIISMLFAGLWCLADKDGILEDRPLRIKAELFPYRDGLDVNGYLTVLEQSGFVTRYVVDGSRYIMVNEFEKHQHPHHTEKPRGYPKPQEKSREHTLTPLSNGDTPSDSLIPDSLIPDSTSKALSGKPDVSVGNGKKKLSEACAEVLEFLNEKTGRNYKPVPANINLIAARLKQGATVVECRQVIAKKCREWRADPNQEIYLRPKTLFNATNFANYQGELGSNE